MPPIGWDRVDTAARPATGVVMALFMDVRTIGRGGVSAAEVVDACNASLTAHGRYGAGCLRYWVSKPAEKVFFLVEGDDLALVQAIHREIPGLVDREIYPVSEHTWHRPITA